MSRDQRHKVLDFAAGELATADMPPWASFDYTRLRETLEVIVQGMEAAAQHVEGSPPSEPELDSTLLQIASDDQPMALPSFLPDQ
jgi:hypothetical protein